MIPHGMPIASRVITDESNSTNQPAKGLQREYGAVTGATCAAILVASSSTSSGPVQRYLFVLASIGIVVALLSWARAILIPFVLAILLTFALGPVVIAVQRRGLSRVLSVLVVVTVALLVLSGIAFVVLSEVAKLGEELPNHKEEILRKVVAIREASKGSWIDRLSSTFEEVKQTAKETEKAPTEPLPVKVETWDYHFLESAVSPALGILAGAGLVLILVIFMLIQREELRNRLIRLWKNGGVSRITRVLDDAGRRISRFLFMQLLINASFGVIVGGGLAIIGVPYPVLWGFLGAVLRYIPYVGAWIAAGLPLILSIAVFPGWLQPLLVVVLYAVLELFISNVIEPRAYGRSIGVSEVALLLAAAFWTWLWGPIGLVLATPLTACLVVLGRHVPQLELLSMLLGDQPALEPHVAFYQRLLARDEDEAADVVEEYLAKNPIDELYDRVLVPALILVREGRERDELSAVDEQFIATATQEILSEVVLPLQPAVADTAETTVAKESSEPVLVLGCPARDELDELVLLMVQQMNDSRRCRFEIVSAKVLTAEVVDRVEQQRPALVAIGSLPPEGLAHARYLCKRLRAQFPELRILVGRWELENYDGPKARQRLQSAGATHVANSLLKFREQLLPQVQVFSQGQNHRLAYTR
jgi:predicted PurR-regulated permease PerM